MKKVFALLLLTCFSVYLVSPGMCEVLVVDVKKVNDQYEYVIENNEITITRYIGNETEVSIPSEIDGVPVTEVGFAAFYGTQIKTVVIGEGIRRIGVEAFSETGLISVSLPSTLEVIEDSAFAMSPLKTAVIPDGVKSIGETLFYGCTDLTEVTLPKSIEILPSGCFFECMSLKRIEIPEGLMEIGDQCFYFCISLEECLLPESLNVIGCEAFALCSALPALDIPASVCCLKGGCFWDCTSLERIVFHSDIVVDENWDEYMFGQWRDLTPQRLAITVPVGSGIASFCAGMGLNVEVQ